MGNKPCDPRQITKAVNPVAPGDYEMEKGHQHHVDMRRNSMPRIQNPLAGVPRDALLANVEEFAREVSLVDHIALLQRGALVAQDPSAFEQVAELDDHEREALQNEVLHKWRQPKALYVTIVLCSIGAAVQGWNQASSNGSTLSWPAALDVPDTGEYATDSHAWVVGLVNASPSIACCLIGCWLADPLNSAFGRKGAIFVSAIVCLFSVLGSALSRTWPRLFIARLLLGVGMGIVASTVPIYAAESCPTAIRGGLVTSWQLGTAFGTFLGFCANLAVYNAGDIAWRLQLGSALIPAILLAIGVFSCPESPRWYIKKNRYRDAFLSLLKLRNNPIQAARDLYYIHAQMLEESSSMARSSCFTRFRELFSVPRVRRATLASWTVMISQQLCGINIVAFYSSTVFVNAGAGQSQALLASLGFGLANFFFAWLAVFTIDTFGRRTLLLFTFPNMAWTLLATAFCFYLPDDSKARVGTIACFVYLFAAFYIPGGGSVPFTYSAEVFPLSHREVGMAWAVATYFFYAALLSITFPRLLQALGPTGAFGFYAGLNLCALIMIFLFVPETKQRTLEELDYVFAVPTRTHIRYQLTKALPWWIKRYAFFRRHAQLEPLYHFEVGTQRVDPKMLIKANKAKQGAADKTTKNTPSRPDSSIQTWLDTQG